MVTIDNNVVIPPDDEEESKSDVSAKMTSFHLKSEQGFKVDEDKVKKLQRINKLKEERNLAGHSPSRKPPAGSMPPPLVPKQPLRSMGTHSSVGGGYGARAM